MYALGMDLGTTTLSAVVVDPKSGEVLRSLTVPLDARVEGEHWESLFDATRIWAQTRGMLSGLMAEFGEMSCIGLTGQMHGVLYFDTVGRAVSPLMNWQDGRGARMNDNGLSYARHYSKLTGYPLSTGYGTLTHMVNLAMGRVPSKASGFCAIHDFVGMQLTGRALPLTHDTDAASFGVYDIHEGGFDAEALLRAGVSASLFPEVTTGISLLGQTDCDGIPKGIPVAVAIGDNQASFIGSVAFPEKSVLVTVGTSGQVSLVVNRFEKIPNCELRPCPGDGQLLVGFSLCGGRAYALLEKLFREVATRAGAKDKPLYGMLNLLAGEGDGSITVNTAFDGTRENPDSRGHIDGISTTNFTPANLVRGVVEGIVSELHRPYQSMRQLMLQMPTEMVGSGNAIRQNPALRSAFERAFGMPLRMPRHTEEAAYGAALYALAAAGIAPSLSAARAIIQYEQSGA